jgi:hypothetical protein
VYVFSDTGPTINLIGGDVNGKVTVTQGDKYPEHGATAFDVAENGQVFDLTPDIEIDNSSVDTEQPGTYYVQYRVLDQDDIVGRILREVEVLAE